MTDKTIRIAGTANDSIVDGPGLRFTIFTQGCPHKCEGCHNPNTHSFDGGHVENISDLFDKIKDNKLLDGVTFSGGEPFCQAEALYELGLKIHELGLDIITYTGYTYDFLMQNSNDKNAYEKLLSVTDYLVDGKFEQDKKSYELKFKGSSNQRIIDVKKSIADSKIIETIL